MGIACGSLETDSHSVSEKGSEHDVFADQSINSPHEGLLIPYAGYHFCSRPLATNWPSYASAYHNGGIYGVMEQWLDGGVADSPERMAAEALAIMPSNFIPAAVAKARSPL